MFFHMQERKISIPILLRSVTYTFSLATTVFNSKFYDLPLQEDFSVPSS